MKDGDIVTIKQFAWWPVKIGKKVKWLKYIKYRAVFEVDYVDGNHKFKPVKFL